MTAKKKFKKIKFFHSATIVYTAFITVAVVAHKYNRKAHKRLVIGRLFSTTTKCSDLGYLYLEFRRVY
jgi:hypothetical protein